MVQSWIEVRNLVLRWLARVSHAVSLPERKEIFDIEGLDHPHNTARKMNIIILDAPGLDKMSYAIPLN